MNQAKTPISKVTEITVRECQPTGMALKTVQMATPWWALFKSSWGISLRLVESRQMEKQTQKKNRLGSQHEREKKGRRVNNSQCERWVIADRTALQGQQAEED